VRSQDSGTTWLTPTLVADAAAAGWSNVDKPRLALDAAGNVLHATWLHSIPAGGVGPQEIYYARSTDQGRTWSSPVRIAEGNVDWPRLIVPDTEQVYLAWNEATTNAGQANLATPYKAHGQFSADGGQRWSSTADIPGFQQVSGPLGLTGGGAGRMYLTAIGQGVGQEAVLLNAYWNGQAWVMGETLSLGQQAAVGNAAVAAVNPAKGQLVAVLKMHDLDQLQTGHTGISSTGRGVESAPLVPMPTFTPAPTATATPAPTSTPQPLPRAEIITGSRLPASDSGGPSGLIVGALFAAVIVVGVAVAAIWKKRS
jgi:hypothetical protein